MSSRAEVFHNNKGTANVYPLVFRKRPLRKGKGYIPPVVTNRMYYNYDSNVQTN